MQWTEYPRKRRVRWQFLCYTLHETFTVTDEFLVGELGVDAAMQRLIPEDGSSIYCAPIAIRSPNAHPSSRAGVKIKLDKIQHSLTSEITGLFRYCFHISEIRNLDMIVREGLRPGGRRRGRLQVFSAPLRPGTGGSRTCWDWI